MEPKANNELDPLLKQYVFSCAIITITITGFLCMKQNNINYAMNRLRASASSSWKKRSVLLITIILILFVVYLIISSVSPSLKLNNKNNIAMYNPSSHIVGTDPFETWNECDSIDNPPQLIAYHIHGVFDGNDQESVSFAYKLYHEFIQYTNPNMNECEFAHSTPAINQDEVCYFPTTWQETDFPVPSNFIFQSSNYAFFIPPKYLQQSLTFWMQHHNDPENDQLIDYVAHTVSGCQMNDHTKWLIVSGGYDPDLVTDNLLCCHNGPAMCTCNMVQYQLDNNNNCLAIDFNDDDINFISSECEDATNKNIGTWRETIYNEENNWIQIENFGDIDHPMYLCLTIDTESDCNIGDEIIMRDCAFEQDIDNDIWISPNTQFMYDFEQDQIKLLGCADNLCVDINEDEEDGTRLRLSVATCDKATRFEQRHFFP